MSLHASSADLSRGPLDGLHLGDELGQTMVTLFGGYPRNPIWSDLPASLPFET